MNLIKADSTVTLDARDLRDAFILAVQLRNAQINYFANRSTAALTKSKDLERQFDTIARKMFAGPDLFAERKPAAVPATERGR